MTDGVLVENGIPQLSGTCSTDCSAAASAAYSTARCPTPTVPSHHPWSCCLSAYVTRQRHETSFARGLERDRAAVNAALTRAYHDGGTEGVNNRTKLIKRQMFGRAGFPLRRSDVDGDRGQDVLDVGLALASIARSGGACRGRGRTR
jgi:hypothetical protein